MNDEVLVTSKAAADQLGIDRATLSRHTHQGLIKVGHRSPGVRGTVLYRQGELDRYKMERETT